MATYGFLSRFMQGRQGPSAQMQGAIDALKGQNGRAGLMDDAAALGQVATDAITNPGATASLNAPVVGGVQPSGNPSGTAATTGEGGNADGARAEREPAGSGGNAGAAGNVGELPAVPDAVEATRLSPDTYHWNQDFMTNFLEAPITPEQQEKRTRAAHAVAGIGNLGNVLSAFSNLAFAGKAPSQTLPQVPEAGAAVDKERRRWDTVRKDYVNGKLQGRSMDVREYQTMVQLNRAVKQAELDTQLKEQQLKKAIAEGADAQRLAELRVALAEAKAREADAKAKIAEGNLNDQARQQEDKHNNATALTEQRRASAGLSGKRAETEGQRKKTEENRTETEGERTKTERTRQEANEALAESRRNRGSKGGIVGNVKPKGSSGGGKGKGYGTEDNKGKGRGY